MFYPFRELLKSRLPGEIHGKRSAVFQKRCAISSLNIFQHHTKMFLRLKTAPHSNHKRILGEGQNVSFCEHLLHLISVQHKLLVHLLHRKSHLSLFVSYKVNSTVIQEEKTLSQTTIAAFISSPLPTVPTNLMQRKNLSVHEVDKYGGRVGLGCRLPVCPVEGRGFKVETGPTLRVLK